MAWLAASGGGYPHVMWMALGIPLLIMVLALAMESVEARVIRTWRTSNAGGPSRSGVTTRVNQLRR